MKRKHVAAVVAVLFVFALAHAWVIAITGGLVLVAGYLIDVRLKPRTACDVCDGRGGHGGWLFGWGQSDCLQCGGKKTRVRWGARMFGSDAARREFERQRAARRAGHRR